MGRAAFVSGGGADAAHFNLYPLRARFKISGSRIADYASLVHMKRNGKHGIDWEECLWLRAGTDTNAFSLSV
jgi:hypothetical protein